MRQPRLQPLAMGWLVMLLGSFVLLAGCGSDSTVDPTHPTIPVDPFNPADSDRVIRVGPQSPGELDFVSPGSPERPIGATDFASADAVAGQDSGDSRDDSSAPTAGEDEFDADGGGERTVEEGDIYRVLEGSLILNLNAYRGVQVIDFSDVENPEIIGRLQISGSPVEMYVVGDRAFVLLNNWRGYYGARDDIAIETRDGGLALSVDLSDPTAPEVIDQAWIPGYIGKSRLTRGGSQAALYVVTGGWAQWQNDDGSWEWDSRTYVKSFDVSDGELTARSQLNLGGYIADIQATTEVLMVARNDYNWSDSQSQVAVVDISDPTGVMVMGDQVTAEGWINNQFNMDYRNGILRVVSGSRWGSDNTNFMQTFDASDLQNIEPIDTDTFGHNEDLYATLFLENSAFCVTYFRQDPFHAFAIGDDGSIVEMSEFVVSGWNDFFRPVFDESRLVGIGVDDADGSRSLAVSLYDITSLTNPNPLVSRAEVEADYSWSEANWDHRAFSVLEDAVTIPSGEGPDAVVETGLVLLPFSGWNDRWEEYTAAVQIFTFSDTTLTRRGLMVHGTPVRRSFEADKALVGNLSEAELSLFDTADPDNPEELGRVDLAPNYNDVMVFGDYRARVENNRDYYYGWWGSRAELPPATVEIVPDDVNPDTGRAVASFDIPSGATVYQSGTNLVTAEFVPLDTTEWPYTYETTLTVWDLSDPTEPTLAGELVTDRLNPYNYYYGWYEDCWDCGWYPYYGGFGDDVEEVPGGLVFLQRHDERELVGTEEVCNTYPSEYEDCWMVERDACVYYSGSISCRSLNDDEPYCTGAIQQCTYTADDGSYDCVEIDPDSIGTTTSCYEYERYRYWQHFSLEVLDLRDPVNPALADTLDLGRDNEGVSMVVDGSDVWVTYKRPYDVDGDSRPYVRYFGVPVDVSDVANPAQGDPINIPGELLAVDGDDIFTRDLVYGEEVVETAIARSQIFEGRAYLQAIRRFEDQYVQSVDLDGAGHVLVSHRLHWSVAYAREEYDSNQYLTLLEAASDDLAILSESPVDSWATLKDARAGRALFQVPGGLLIMNLDDATSPYPQAYFATRGWPTEILVEGRDILFAAGRYGIYEFDLDTFNLLPLF